ncbi:hypothetical protein [Staphylococcus epidermidis]|nr:hypothetical protein [Staphylococcus epidermidis]
MYRNRCSLIRKRGDIGVWRYGWAGDSGIVVGGSEKKSFGCVDENW